VHEYAPLAITLVAIFAGILVNKVDVSNLKADMKDLKADFKTRFEQTDKQIDYLVGRMQVIEADLRQFYAITGELKGRFDGIEKRL